MDRSKLSHIISTTRLLPHFSPTNVDAMKSCLFDQLEIKTESQFLCIVLNSLYKTLSVESLSIIRSKALQIAENQLMEHDSRTTSAVTTRRSNSNAKAKSIDSQQHKSNMTVYKYIQKQHHSGLCRLHSDIIDYFGTFLTKKQSIEFGYLNKQLFIETQKQSYLLKRCKDEMFKFNFTKWSKISIGKNDAFNYTFPRSLALAFQSNHSNMVSKMAFFANFFRRLSILHCSFSSLYFVPLKYIFIKHRNYYPNSESCDNMDVFRLFGYLHGDEASRKLRMNEVDVICKKFDNLLTNINDDEHEDKIITNLRCIKRFEFDSLLGTKTQESIDCMNLLAKRLLIRFGNISKSIYLFSTQLTLQSISEIKRIFHPDLRHVFFNNSAKLQMIVDDDRDGKILTSSAVNIATSLKCVSLDTRLRAGSDPTCVDVLNELDKFDIRRNVEKYIIHWWPPTAFHQRLVTLNIGNAVNIFDKIFFQDYDKHPLLKSIIIKFQDDRYLLGLARLLLYFHQHYKQIFVERKLCLTHFRTIEIEIDRVWMLEDGLQRYPHATSNPEFFAQRRNEEYSIDDNKIDIKSCQFKQGIESFGIIYENIFYWLSRLQSESCRIILHID